MQKTSASGLASLAGEGRLVAVTDGADGVFWLDGTTLRQQRPPPITALDTTGAGDAFHGAFALALARGQALLPALRFARPNLPAREISDCQPADFMKI